MTVLDEPESAAVAAACGGTPWSNVDRFGSLGFGRVPPLLRAARTPCQAWDTLTGHVWSPLDSRPEYLDIVGVNTSREPRSHVLVRPHVVDLPEAHG
jgi:hypothetical protein